MNVFSSYGTVAYWYSGHLGLVYLVCGFRVIPFRICDLGKSFGKWPSKCLATVILVLFVKDTAFEPIYNPVLSLNYIFNPK